MCDNGSNKRRSRDGAVNTIPAADGPPEVSRKDADVKSKQSQTTSESDPPIPEAVGENHTMHPESTPGQEPWFDPSGVTVHCRCGVQAEYDEIASRIDLEYVCPACGTRYALGLREAAS